MNKKANIKIYSPILQEAHESITPLERASFDLNFSISEKIYQILQKKGMTKRDLTFPKLSLSLPKISHYEKNNVHHSFHHYDNIRVFTGGLVRVQPLQG